MDILSNLLEEKVGFGRAQMVCLFFLCLVDMNDGVQLVLSSFLTPIVKAEWKLTNQQASLLASLFYGGVLCGSLCSGKLSDIYGRRKLILIGSVGQIFGGLFFGLVNDYSWMLIARFLYGFWFGFTIALTTSMFAQCCTTTYRGKGMLLLNFCISFGKIFGVILAYMCLDSFTKGRWKLMMALSVIPNFVVIYGVKYLLCQSPRYLAVNGYIDQACLVLNRMSQQNGGLSINNQDKESLERWHRETVGNAPPTQFKALFSPVNRAATICLSGCWFCINVAYYGQLVMLPFIFGKGTSSFASYALTILGEAPSFFISLLIIDRPNFGRKMSMVYFFTCAGALHAMFGLNMLTIISSASRFAMKMCFQMLYPCTTQSFGTRNRTLGFGFCSAMGRFGAVLMPYMFMPLVDNHTSLIFYLLGILCSIGALCAYSLPRDPTSTGLEEKLVVSANS